jgi:hypothetical protein
MELFISHATADLEIAQAIRLRLDEVAPELTCFLLADDVFASDDWEQRIQLAARSCDAILCLATPSYVSRPWFSAEWAVFWFQDKPWYLVLLDVELAEIFAPMTRRQAIRLDDRRSVQRLLSSLVANGDLSARGALDLLASEIVDSVRAAVQRRDVGHAEAALARFAVSMRRGTPDVESDVVHQLLRAGQLDRLLDVAKRSENWVALRQFAVLLVSAGVYDPVAELADRIENNAERRTVGVGALDAYRVSQVTEEPLELAKRIYVSVREPQRRDLREAARKRGLAISWPSVDPRP